MSAAGVSQRADVLLAAKPASQVQAALQVGAGLLRQEAFGVVGLEHGGEHGGELVVVLEQQVVGLRAHEHLGGRTLAGGPRLAGGRGGEGGSAC